MAAIVILVFVGGSIGAAVSYLQDYFGQHDPAAGAWFSRVALFSGSALLITWLLLDPTGVRAPVFALASAAAYLVTHHACQRRSLRAANDSPSGPAPPDEPGS